jgi:hypothetical protein
VIRKRDFRSLNFVIEIQDVKKLSSVKVESHLFPFVAHPYHVSSKPECHSCLEVDTLPLACAVSDKKATALDVCDDLVIDSIVVVDLINTKWSIPSIFDAGLNDLGPHGE